MKRILIDTQVLLWWLKNDPQLGKVAKALVADANNEIFTSAVTAWEISIKVALGKLIAPCDIDTEVQEEGFSPLDITLKHADAAGKLPAIHNDPFDRMLIAQAQAEGLQIMTSDGEIPKYSVQTIDARK